MRHSRHPNDKRRPEITPMAAKRRWRKSHYMKGFHHWVGKSQYGKRRAAREARRLPIEP